MKMASTRASDRIFGTEVRRRHPRQEPDALVPHVRTWKGTTETAEALIGPATCAEVVAAVLAMEFR